MRKIVYFVLFFLPILVMSQPAPSPFLTPYLFAALGSDHFGVRIDNMVQSSEFGQEAVRRMAYAGGAGLELVGIGTNGAGRLDLEAQFEFYGGQFRFLTTSGLQRVDYTGFGITPRLNWGVNVEGVFQPYVGAGATFHRISVGDTAGWVIGPDLAVGMRLNILGICNARFQVETAPLPSLELGTYTPLGDSTFYFEPGFVSVFVGVEFMFCVGCY